MAGTIFDSVPCVIFGLIVQLFVFGGRYLGLLLLRSLAVLLILWLSSFQWDSHAFLRLTPN